MKLTNEQGQMIGKIIEEKILRGGCPSCGSRAFGISDTFAEIHVLQTGSAPVPVYPAVMITCDNCHYIMMFNAMHLGLLPDPGKS